MEIFFEVSEEGVQEKTSSCESHLDRQPDVKRLASLKSDKKNIADHKGTPEKCSTHVF